MIGKTILHYKILSKLGEGGMGVVYKAEDTKIKREVAIKFLPRQVAASDEERERFKIEAQAAGALNHANIATIHAIEEVDDETFIVMEYIKGQELKDRIDAGPLSIDDTLNIGIQIAQGLQIAHEAEVVHRDIKSSNIMLTDHGDVKIMDFGLAKRGGQTKLTKEGTTLGTVSYMSPEQTRGDDVDQRSDIFSLGVLFHEMLSGQPPFKGDYDQAVTYSILNEEPEPVTALRTGIPMEFERIVLKTLAKEPGERYQRVDEMLVDLKNLRKSQESGISRTEKTSVRVDKTGPQTAAPTKTPILVGGVLILLATVAFLLLKPFFQDEPAVSGPRPVVVMPFENQTADAKLDPFGLMAKDWISQGLLESGDAKVITYGEINDLTASKSSTTVPRGAEVLVRGRYYSQSELELSIVAEVIDLNTGEIMHSLGPITGHKNDLMSVLANIQQQLLGYWKLDSQYLGRKPPRFDAYEAYVKGRNLKEDYPFRRKIALFQRALELDSSFVEPLFNLYSLGRYGSSDDLLNWTLVRLETRENIMSSYQQLRFETIKAVIAGDLVRAAGLRWQLYEKYKLDDDALRAIAEFRSANYLIKVIELSRRFVPIEPDTFAGYGSVMATLVNALYDMGLYKEALNEIESFPYAVHAADIAMIHVRLLALDGRMNEVDEKLAFYKTQPLEYRGRYEYPSLVWALCSELYILDRKDELTKYLDLLELSLEEVGSDWLFHGSVMAFVHFVREEYQQGFEAGRILWDTFGVNFGGAISGVCLLKMGREKEADTYIEELKNRPNPFPGASAYGIGVIEAQRDPELAVKFLLQSIDEGYEFDYYAYRRDPLLKILEDYPPFTELTEPK